MHPLRLSSLFVLVALSATAVAAPSGGGGTPTSLPDKPPREKVSTCPANDGRALRYLARGPAAPLVIATKDGLVEGASCCRSVSHRGLSLLALDAFGHPTGEARVDGGDPLPGRPGCFALETSITAGERGQLWVEAPPKATLEDELPSPRGHRAPSVAASLSKEAAASLGDLVDAVTAEAVPQPEVPCPKQAEDRLPLSRRLLAFRGADGVTTAVVGGHLLVVATLGKRRWSVAHVEVAGAEQCAPRRYQPLAAFDMDGDGSIEIVARQDGSPTEGTLVLSRASSDGGRYRVVSSVFR